MKLARTPPSTLYYWLTTTREKKLAEMPQENCPQRPSDWNSVIVLPSCHHIVHSPVYRALATQLWLARERQG